MRSPDSTPRRPPWAVAAVIAAAGALAACGSSPSKDDADAAKNTITCQWSGERLVIRFDAGEARLLMPDGDRVSLYQIPAASGARYSNGIFELRGKGMEMQLIQNGNAMPLVDCQPYQVPKAN
jgi:membrane-bound inhibitor of C-type lysozyme